MFIRVYNFVDLRLCGLMKHAATREGERERKRVIYMYAFIHVYIHICIYIYRYVYVYTSRNTLKLTASAHSQKSHLYWFQALHYVTNWLLRIWEFLQFALMCGAVLTFSTVSSIINVVYVRSIHVTWNVEFFFFYESTLMSTGILQDFSPGACSWRYVYIYTYIDMHKYIYIYIYRYA